MNVKKPSLLLLLLLLLLEKTIILHVTKYRHAGASQNLNKNGLVQEGKEN